MGLIPAVANLEVTTMRLEMKKFDAEKAEKELDITELDPDKIEMDLNWFPFKGAFLNMAKDLMGVDNDPL